MKKNIYIQDLIEADQVVRSMLKTKDGRYLKVAEVTPINFSLMADDHQNSIISSFASWFKICPGNFQIKVITKRADTLKYLEHFEQHMKGIETESMKQVYDSFAMKVRQTGMNNAVTRKYYLIFEYNGGSVLGTVDEAKAEKELTAALEAVGSILRGIGNAIIYPKSAGADGLEFLRFYGEFLFMLFCRRSYTDTGYEDRALRYFDDLNIINAGNKAVTTRAIAESVTLSDIIAPHGAHFSLQPDCYVMDGAYHTHLIIKGDGYPSRVSSSWPVPVFLQDEGVDMDIHVRRIDRAQFINRLKYGTRIARARVSSADETSGSYGDLLSTYQSIEYFRQAMRGDYGGVQQDPFEMIIVLTIHAGTYKELCEKRDNLIKSANTSDFELDPLRYSQLDGFCAASPFMHIPKSLNKRGQRNVATDGICSIYPFTGFELCDDHGIFMGRNIQNGSMCVLDIFDSDKYPNANMCILGGSGSGKTFTLLLMAMRSRMLGNQNFLVTMEKPQEFKRACTAMGGQYIKIGPGSSNCINILEIRPQKSDFYQSVYGYEEGYKSLVAEKTQDIITWVSLMIDDMTSEEEQILDIAVIRMYREFGITKDDNNSIYIDPSNHEKGIKKMPVIGDLLESLLKDKDKKNGERLTAVLRKFTEGSASSFNQQTNVTLDNPFTVFDIEDLSETLKGPVTYQVISSINALIKEDPSIKQSVFIEEGWAFISSTANDKAAKVIQEMWKTIRGYGGSACMCTQQMTDLTESEYGRSVLTQSSIKILLQMDQGEAQAVKQELKLSESEAKFFTGGTNTNPELRKRGIGLMLANSSHVPVIIEASDKEKDLISTDRRDLERAKKDGRSHKETAN